MGKRGTCSSENCRAEMYQTVLRISSYNHNHNTSNIITTILSAFIDPKHTCRESWLVRGGLVWVCVTRYAHECLNASAPLYQTHSRSDNLIR
jgi:hypothetical protein